MRCSRLSRCSGCRQGHAPQCGHHGPTFCRQRVCALFCVGIRLPLRESTLLHPAQPHRAPNSVPALPLSHALCSAAAQTCWSAQNLFCPCSVHGVHGSKGERVALTWYQSSMRSVALPGAARSASSVRRTCASTLALCNPAVCAGSGTFSLDREHCFCSSGSAYASGFG